MALGPRSPALSYKLFSLIPTNAGRNAVAFPFPLVRDGTQSKNVHLRHKKVKNTAQLVPLDGY